MLPLQFEHITHLWALALIPILYFFYTYVKKTTAQRVSILGNPALIQRLMLNSDPKKAQKNVLAFLLGITMFMLAWANPQWGQRTVSTNNYQADVLFIFDVSRSMLAQDVAPDRLTQAKAFALDVLAKVKAEQIGLAIFADKAHLLMPFSSDYNAARMYIETLEPSSISAQGTSVDNALSIIASLKANGAHRNPIVAILITDGESHETTDVKDAAQSLSSQNVYLYALGIGTKEGGYIPDEGGYKKDEQGNIIKTVLNETLLQQLATAAQGKYYNISIRNEATSRAIEDIVGTIQSDAAAGKREKKWHQYHDLESRFQIFIFLGLLCFIYSYRTTYYTKK